MEQRNDFFVTLTFRRDRTKNQVLRSLRNDLYSFTRKFRKHFGHTEYLRAIELHKDDYAHIHLHILCRDFTYAPRNSRYFDEHLYRKLKSLWTLGHTDYQPPRGKGYGVVAYTLKYLNKTSSSSTLWSKLLASTVDSSAEDTPTQQNESIANDTNQSQPVIKESPHIFFLKNTALQSNLLSCPLKYGKYRKITWTRGYVPLLRSTFK
jgi:hypothetical protein